VDKPSSVAELPVFALGLFRSGVSQASPRVFERRLAFCWGALIARVGVMRCMACGGEMILTAVKPDVGMVAGFKHETHQCSVCRDIERRFVFGRGSSGKPEKPLVSAQQPVVSPSPAEAISYSPPQSSSPLQGISSSPSPSEAIASASTWARALEKLRSRQADVHARCNEPWEKLAPAPRKPSEAGNPMPRGRPAHLARKSARALRAELRRRSSASNRTTQPTIEPIAEAVLRFNRFWDSLVQPQPRPSDPPAEASSALAEPLPRSLSLVSVEKP
jgi:hypothetical protein